MEATIYLAGGCSTPEITQNKQWREIPNLASI